MSIRAITLTCILAVAACTPTIPMMPQPAAPPDPAAVARGKYIFDAANCVGCHTDTARGGARLAGGKAIETPFGAYYSRNITPDPELGIGSWNEDAFHRALREGIAPSGAHYFAAFPFTSFTRMTDQDVADLFAYLRTQPPAAVENRAHDVPFPFDARFSMVPWRALYFTPGAFTADPDHDAFWNRGAYLVTAVAHCPECHSPRNVLGAIESDRLFGGGTLAGPGVHYAPNITSDPQDGIGKWRTEDVIAVLKLGALPNGEFVGAPMSGVVEGTKQLTDEDRLAIATYIKSLPAVPGKGG
jgi:mono/diheme cytochrome c family protein